MMVLGALQVIKHTNLICSAAVIFLHGSDSSGPEICNLTTALLGHSSFHDDMNFYFPTAPSRPYTPLNGRSANVWFDRYSVRPDVPEHTETLEETGKEVKELIDEIIKNDGIPLSRIVIGGFSMGGAMALHMAYRLTPGVAGVFALSSFLNDDSSVYREDRIPNTPLYMCHGDADPFVDISWGRTTYERLRKLGVKKAEFVQIRNASHELTKNELLGLFEWIRNVLPPLNNDSNEV